MPAAVSLSQMVDLALGTPEVGAVNFNVLHTLLHAMLSKLEIKDHTGTLDEADRDFLSTNRAGPAVPEKGEISEKKSSDGSTAGGKIAPYHKLLDRMQKLELQLENLNDLPSNADLFGRAKKKDDLQDMSGTSSAPLQDMWQLLQVQKRVDANEIGINKLMSLVGDLMKEMQLLKDKNEELENKLSTLDLGALNERMKQLDDQLNTMNELLIQYPLPEEVVTWEGLEKSLAGIREDIGRSQERIVVEFSTQTEKPEMAKRRNKMSRPVSARPLSSLSHSSSGPSNNLADVLEKLGSINDRHEAIEERVRRLEEELANKADKGDLEGIETGVPDSILKQLNELQADVSALKNSRTSDAEALERMQKAIVKLRGEVMKLNDQTQHLLTENENKQKQIQSLCNITASLEEKKADKDYVDSEVDIKADKKEVNGKVNRTLFDSTCNELNKMISDLLEKLAAYEEAWRNANGKLSSDIDGKLDRLELDALKDYIDSKLRALNQKLKGVHDWMPAQSGDDDAAGLRKQLLQRFHCISCDRPVEMMPTATALQAMPSGTGFPSTRSPRPYTTFELDQIRQHAKSTNGTSVKPTKPVYYISSLLNPDGVDYYSTQRSCGGTHTTTFPHRRTTRLTNLREVFIDDTGFVAPKENERDIQGADGHIYKGRLDRNQNQLPNLPSQTSQTSQQQETPPQQPSPPPARPQTVVPRNNRSSRPQVSPARPVSARSGPRTGSGRLTNRPQSARTESPLQNAVNEGVEVTIDEVDQTERPVIEVHTPAPAPESEADDQMTPQNTEVQVEQ